jgi:hypothetical protein
MSSICTVEGMGYRLVVLWALLAAACSHRPEQGGIFVVHPDADGTSGSWSIDCTHSASECVMPLDAGVPLLEEPSWSPPRGPEPIRCSAGKVCRGDWILGGVSGGYSPAAREPGPVPQPR